jgi:Ternary complex associated domain 9
VKTDRPEVVKHEAEGVRRLAVYFTGAQSARIFPDAPEAPEAVIYPLVSLDSSGTVIELKEMVYLPIHARRDDRPTAIELLRSTYEACRSSHVAARRIVTVGDQYKAYLRETPERLLADPLPHVFPQGENVTIYGQVLKDPRRILESVKQIQMDTVVCPVHGDLHPNNVLFGPNYVPVLIDYAFGHLNGHFIKDFVLMECSLRFLQTPKLLQPDLISRLDDALLAEDGYREVLENPVTGRTGEVLKEMAELVSVIRAECRLRHKDYDFDEYLLAQYMTLLGSLRLLPYQDFRTLRALCRIADYIEEKLRK